mmetsp:Transcript_20536/g.52751  ORF Transcript_20536/g.52751 Transcript_20536/m.52751 type:complete len:210 (-) Transcript_20536:631-1260(-)|eukprot:CAMPEP_0113879438 /NCGR_PEP_ID=MMETSP0780_2-20120614/7239_1 /TAXON_ID=652834 /ORGANISM="Palpitomonas bilix" /LENGTH=209 /DNA_ID=CAMNT_0000866021 /DNA_START=248 /DNA_END=877 /DNA_ORIENTATION=- /assembly_acc=CAM_ASM_000599
MACIPSAPPSSHLDHDDGHEEIRREMEKTSLLLKSTRYTADEAESFAKSIDQGGKMEKYPFLDGLETGVLHSLRTHKGEPKRKGQKGNKGGAKEGEYEKDGLRYASYSSGDYEIVDDTTVQDALGHIFATLILKHEKAKGMSLDELSKRVQGSFKDLRESKLSFWTIAKYVIEGGVLLLTIASNMWLIRILITVVWTFAKFHGFLPTLF